MADRYPTGKNNSNVHKTLFRTCGGFKLIYENPIISRTWKKEGIHTDDECHCISAILNLFSDICTDNDENVNALAGLEIGTPLSRFLSSDQQNKLRVSSANLIFVMSQNSNCRKSILKCQVADRIVTGLLSLLTAAGDSSVYAVGAINNLALEERFTKDHAKIMTRDFIPAIAKLMDLVCIINEGASLIRLILPLMPTSLSTMGNLVRDPSLRKVVSEDQDIWNASINVINTYQDKQEDQLIRKIIYSLLGFLMNLTAGNISIKKEVASECLSSAYSLIESGDEDITERVSGLLNHLMTSSPDVIDEVINKELYREFIKIIEGGNVKAQYFIIKCLALCTQKSKEARECFLKEKALKSLLKLLSTSNELAVGNTALCISYCAENDKLSDKLVSTNVIQDLLRIATNEQLRKDARQNAAVAAGKLASSNPRHLQRVRELHGLEILHEVMKINKLV